jgi:PAS domain S-box-containing protein
LSSNGGVLGSFALYYREPREPNEREVAWVRRAGHLAAIAVMRDRAEQALRASEARYRQIVDTAYEGVWLVDDKARTSFVNARAAELLGYSVDEMLGRSLFEFMDPDERAFAEGQMLRRFQKISEQHEFKFRRKDGTTLWALVAASPLLDEQGAAVGALGMLTDITRLKHAEATLRDNELELRTIFESAAIGIALVDEEGRPRRSNTALQKMLGYSGDELARMRFAEFTHPDDAGSDLESYRRMLAGEISSYQLEKRFLHRSGHVVWGRLTASLVRIEGRALFGIGMVEDITANKLAQARISAQAALLDQATDAILVRSSEGVIEYWNRGAQRLYGWSSEEVVGRNVVDLLYRDPVQYFGAQNRLLAEGSWSGELVQQTQSGQQVTVECRWTLARDESGGTGKVLAINTDVTDKKRLEAQIISAQRMESLGTLAGGIAHDFNNILAAIVANVSLARDDVGYDHPAQMALSEINDASLRAAALVRQILTFSRRRPPERRVIRLDAVVTEALKLLRATLPASIRIETALDADAPAVFADPTQVHQVVMNLGTNAAHAMRERGGVLGIRCEGVSLEGSRGLALGELQPGSYTRLVIEDNGVGMSRDTLKRVFEPFFTTKGPGEGTGLGLSVVHGVMRAHEGGVEVVSNEGEGSRFELYFPATPATYEQAMRANQASIRGRGERILCVDDELSILRATTLILERLGYEAVPHSEPARALAELSAPTHFDAIVTDCSMPTIWGLEFVREVLARRPSIPIVMMSGLLEPGLERALRDVGVREFVSKPATVEELGAALSRSINAHASAPA